MSVENRLIALLGQNKLVGIDFVFVYDHDPDNNKRLDVYFLYNENPPLPTFLGTAIGKKKIHIYAVSDPNVKINLNNEPVWNGNVLQLTVTAPGDISIYQLFIDDPGIDLYFNKVNFSFKPGCNDLDCAPAEHECPPEKLVDTNINYLSRDFWSFRQSLLDFATLRYPGWTDRLEADAGIMMAEVMSALGDEMAYYQDRIGREAYLETASQRRSLRRHARLIDYNMHDGLGAITWMDIRVKGKDDILVPAGLKVWALNDQGHQTYFEVGRSLREAVDPNSIKTFALNETRNSFDLYSWDLSKKQCLPAGTTEIYIAGEHKDNLPFDSLSIPDGKWVLLKTAPNDPALPIRAHLVRLIEVKNENDPLTGDPITHLKWSDKQALPFEVDAMSLKVHGNIVPATAGLTRTSYFVIGADATGINPGAKIIDATGREMYWEPAVAVEREGHDKSVTYLFSLPETDIKSLVWLPGANPLYLEKGIGDNPPSDSPHEAEPEIVVTEISGFTAGANNTWTEAPSLSKWLWKRSGLIPASSHPQDPHYTLDDGTWRRVVGYQRMGTEIVHYDYASEDGFTVRFGDGTFGLTPAKNTVFRVDYRIGGGRIGNVPAGSLVHFTAQNNVLSVENPLPASGGLDPETASEVRQQAPEAFKSVVFRAVRPEDYARAAEILPDVQKAGAVFRWTGSWISAFATPDPLGSVVLEEPLRKQLVNQLDRFRQAGREVIVQDPQYADLDLEINICVEPQSYIGEVEERVWEALLGKKGINSKPGYFSEDNFTFDTPLERANLEAVVQGVQGVRAVERINIRRRGFFRWREFREMWNPPGSNTIIRIKNDPLKPERGTLKLNLHGGV